MTTKTTSARLRLVAAAPRSGRQERRPNEIELLLDGERPKMEQRRRRLTLFEVIEPSRSETEVRRERRRVQAVPDGLPRANQVEQEVRSDLGREQRERRCRQDPPRTAGVKADERDRALLRRLGEQDPGDQEAGDHEEDVHADVTAGERADAGVAQHHEQHRHRAQALDIAATAFVHAASLEIWEDGGPTRSKTTQTPLRAKLPSEKQGGGEWAERPTDASTSEFSVHSKRCGTVTRSRSAARSRARS
jgi:hypothetical protein